MKILMLGQCIMPPNIGMGTRAFEFSKNLVKLGHEVQFICSKRDKNVKNYFRDSGITFHAIYEPRKPLLASSLMIPPMFFKSLNLNFDLCHGHMYYGSLVASWLKKIKGKPYVYDIHGLGVEEYVKSGLIKKNSLFSKIIKKLDKDLFYDCDIPITISNLMVPFLKKRGLFRKDLNIIPNGVDTNLFNPKKIKGNKINEKYGDNIVLHVGLLEEWAGGEIIIKAAREVIKVIKDVTFLFVGGGPKLNELVELVKKNKLDSNIKFTGFVNYNEIPKYISASKICLISFPFDSSTQVAHPIKVLEYMSMGKPIVSTYAKVTADLINSAKSGYVVGKNDYKNYALKIVELLNNYKKSKKMGFNGRKIVKENFEWFGLTKRLVKVYKKII